MKISGSALRFASRIALASVFVFNVAYTMHLSVPPFGAALEPFPDFVRGNLGTAALCSLLAMVSIWLAFGVRTRVVALIGFALYLGLQVIAPGLENLQTSAMIELALVAVLTLPLVAFGGGRFCVYRGGWQDVI